MAFSKPVSMELDDDEKYDAVQPIAMPNKPDFPYGLRISLTERDLAKLHLDIADCDVGDYLEIEARCRVTHVTKSDSEDAGKRGCVELQIETIEDLGDDE